MEKREIGKPTFVLLGETGTGKSTIGNCLLGPNTFKASCAHNSETSKSITKSGRLLIESEGFDIVNVVDTPGLADSKGKDSDIKHIEGLIREMRELRKVKAFFVVFNGTTRWSAATWHTLSYFNAQFPNFWPNVIFLINHWKMTEDAKEDREQSGQSEDKMKENIKTNMKQFGLEAEIPVYFVDALYKKGTGKENSFKQTINEILKKISKTADYPTGELTTLIKKDIDPLMKKIDEYFDHIDEKSTTLLRDINDILILFNEKDQETRLSQDNYKSVLCKEVEEKFPKKMFESIAKIIEKNLTLDQSFNIPSSSSSPLAYILGASGSSVIGILSGAIAYNLAFLTSGGLAWGAAGGLAVLEASAAAGASAGSFTMLSTAAATGIGLGIAALGGITIGIIAISWTRKGLISDLAKQIRNNLLKDGLKQKVKNAVEDLLKKLLVEQYCSS